MIVKELIDLLNNVDPNLKVCIYCNGIDTNQEIIGLFEEEDYNDNGNLTGKHVDIVGIRSTK